MPTSLEQAIKQAADAFAMEIVEAVKGSSLNELLALTGGAAPKRRGRKPGPKPKTGRKPGRPPKTAKKKPGPKPKIAKKAAKKAAKRLSRDQKAQVLDNIVAYLEQNPDSKTPVIAKSVGILSRKAGLYLKELKDKKRVYSKGKKVNMVYRAKK